MSNFRLSEEDEPQPAPAPAPPPKASAPMPDPSEAAAQYDEFLIEDTPAPQNPVPAPKIAPIAPSQAQTQAQAQAQPQATPAQNPNAAPPRVRPVTQVNPVSRPAPPTSPGATPATAAANAMTAAVAPTPATAPATDAASVASHGPSDDFSSNLAHMGNSVKKVLDACEPVATWMGRLTFPLAALSLAYILAALFLGGAASLSTPPTTPEANAAAATLIGNLTLASKLFAFSLIGLAFAIAILAYDDNRIGAIIAGIGLVLFFGTAPLLKMTVGFNAGSIVIAYFVQLAAKVLLGLGLFKGFFDLMSFLFSLPDRVKAKNATVGMGRQIENKQLKIAREANMMSPCWKLPFCREAIRKMCPAFLAKKTCWKFGRGCYCDEEMIGRIVRGESLEVIKSPTKMSKTKPPCGQCYIYLEHQGHKFRMMSPLVLPATIAICFAAAPIYTQIFDKFNAGLLSVFSSLSFSSAGLTPDAIKTSAENVKAVEGYAADPAQVASISMWIMGLVLGFFVLIYLSKALEWFVFKAKL